MQTNVQFWTDAEWQADDSQPYAIVPTEIECIGNEITVIIDDLPDLPERPDLIELRFTREQVIAMLAAFDA